MTTGGTCSTSTRMGNRLYNQGIISTCTNGNSYLVEFITGWPDANLCFNKLIDYEKLIPVIIISRRQFVYYATLICEKSNKVIIEIQGV